MTFQEIADKYNIDIKILKCLRGRYDSHGRVFLSRKEHDKFGLTENQMLGVIRKLRRLGLITKVGAEKKTEKQFTPSNTYTISSIIKEAKILATNVIQKINDFVDGISVMAYFGFTSGKKQGKKFRFKNTKGKLSGVVIFDSNVVYNHKKEKAESIFNYVKRKLNTTPSQTIEWFLDNTNVTLW